MNTQPKRTRRAAEQALAEHISYLATMVEQQDTTGDVLGLLSEHQGHIHGDETVGYRADCKCGWAQL